MTPPVTPAEETVQQSPNPAGEKKEPASPTPPVPPEGDLNANVGGSVGAQAIAKSIEQHNYFNGTAPPEPLFKLLVDLPKLPPGHVFRDPKHDQLLETLEKRRVLVLMSYREKAAFAVGHALLTDRSFSGKKARALLPSLRRDKARTDVEWMNLTDNSVMEEDQILLVEIDSKCTLLDSIVDAAHGTISSVIQKLEQRSAYMVLSIDERLLEGDDVAEKLSGLASHTVSHLCYLLTRDCPDRAADLEKRLQLALGPISSPTEKQQHYKQVDNLLAQGVAELEAFLEKLESTMHLAPAMRNEQLRSIEPADVLRKQSDVHQAVAFVAAYLPELNQNDFDRFVRLLLADKTTKTKSVRQAFRRDGKLVTVQEDTEEPCVRQWVREGDAIFADCYLRTEVSANGSGFVDFSEPYLRDELRSYLKKHHPWYLRSQCQRLQSSGILFAFDLSPKAVEGLVQLFVERAIVDPSGFGSSWLLELVLSTRADGNDEPPPDSADGMLRWLAEKLAHMQFSLLFHERLSTLIREMLDRDGLHPVVLEFFEHLLRAGQHDALLEFVLDLRFAPDFDPLIWIRRVLDEGSDAVRQRTHRRLIDLARRSGPRIYEIFATIQQWLPDKDSLTTRFSSFVALEFPFTYCAEQAKWVAPGAWPSEHPIFYALPDDLEEARKAITSLIEWIMDTRGAALETADAANPLSTAESVRMNLVADLIEHWAWVLEGPPSEEAPPEGLALFAVVVEQLDSRLSPSERTWLLRTWQQRQEEQLKRAGAGSDRSLFISRKTKLEQLRLRFARPRKPLDLRVKETRRE